MGFEPTDQLLDRLISSQVPSTNSATLPLRSNQGREDSVNRYVVDDLVISRKRWIGAPSVYLIKTTGEVSLPHSSDRIWQRTVGFFPPKATGQPAPSRNGCGLIDLFPLRIPLFLAEVLVIVRELVHGLPEEAHQRRGHGIEPLRGLEEECRRADDAA